MLGLLDIDDDPDIDTGDGGALDDGIRRSGGGGVGVLDLIVGRSARAIILRMLRTMLLMLTRMRGIERSTCV